MKQIKIGRGESCDVVLKDGAVSREHLEIFQDDEGNTFLTDLNSSNGTFVNGKRVSGSVKLSLNDIVKVGNSVLPWRNYLKDGYDSLNEGQIAKEAVTAEVDKGIPTSFPTEKKSYLRSIIIVLVILAVAVLVVLLIQSSHKEKENLEATSGLDDNTETVSNGETGFDNSATSQNENQFSTPSDKIIEPGEVEYDFSCLSAKDETATTDVINTLSDIEGGLIDMYGEEVSISEEHDMGRDLLSEISVSDYGVDFQRIQRICNQLVKSVPNKKGYQYKIHFVNEDVINAYTAGGQIFVYKGMIDFCRNDNELAAIIAHEIAHNELGHIKRKISEIKTMENIGGELTAGLFMAATTSFGQKMETYCDLYGIDLAIKAGYNGCEVVNVWKRMEDDQFNSTDAMIRSHPFSEQRADCCQNHIDNYHYNRCK